MNKPFDPAKVARVGRRLPGQEALPRSPWRTYLRDLARVMLLAIAVSLVSAATVLVMSQHRPPVRCASATPDCNEQTRMYA